ncbi:ErfK/YbiS/YcfS/YnhG family lipoprotein [Nocardia seriolae]|uniref:ErfK/YbiS/YcfS/YnhG family lipoprotein n=1 Tax=Nocardia seriolae TaxID=37332 RepID=A0ABC9Z0R6_9NOCA|nr:Ig-like domain-containing protein [Nocardia seriolae]GAM49097.1 ErfK/YbiS/YcfS/YnhG family lipoprotein [Nocardia seriolae]GAP31053.1 ErfK/YbiS/YcfS/YnhG family lipoprotein [Nocardia seriolae]
MGPRTPVAQSITVTPAQGSDKVDPSAPVKVSTSSGVLTDVSLTNEDGKVIEGTFTPDKTAWKPNEQLGYGRTYTLKAAGEDVTGLTGPVTSTFTTISPKNQTKVYLNTTGGQAIVDGNSYGVGMVIVAHFDEDIADRAAAQKRLVVTADPPVEVAWYWMDNRNAHFRPKEYWKPGTKVSVAANLYGVEVGNGLFGQEDSKANFVIGPSHVSIADDNTHQVQVFENGQLVRTMPTSMGRGGSETIAGKTFTFWTMPGTYTVMDKANPVIMDSSTYGLPVNSRLGYKEAIGWATRISTDGIYLHQLDSTVWAQGNTDTSHGCLNLNAENAQWFFNFAQPGDVVEVRNTGGAPLEVWQNGDWTLSWDQWLAGSAH